MEHCDLNNDQGLLALNLKTFSLALTFLNLFPSIRLNIRKNLVNNKKKY